MHVHCMDQFGITKDKYRERYDANALVSVFFADDAGQNKKEKTVSAKWKKAILRNQTKPNKNFANVTPPDAFVLNCRACIIFFLSNKSSKCRRQMHENGEKGVKSLEKRVLRNSNKKTTRCWKFRVRPILACFF